MEDLTGMKVHEFGDFDLNIARTRIILSLFAMLSLYVDPSTAGGLFHLTPYALTTLACHLTYSVGIYYTLQHGPARRRLASITLPLDLLFATAIAYLTEGQTSPSYVFFVFAIIAVGIRSGLRTTICVTLCGVGLYLLVIALSEKLAGFYVMRAVYLAIAGYLVGFFGQQRLNYEERVRLLEAQAERHSIARSLHDSYVQSLAGVNLRLETCRELLRRGHLDAVSQELKELQLGVLRQYDEVRDYIRTLAGVDSPSSREAAATFADPGVRVEIKFNAPSWIAERILQIALEGLRNARKHARASFVKIDAVETGESVLVTIADDGVGFASGAAPPWTIASHVAEAGGHLHIDGSGSGYLKLEMPRF
jgi:signal transduction histidine kinase